MAATDGQNVSRRQACQCCNWSYLDVAVRHLLLRLALRTANRAKPVESKRNLCITALNHQSF